MGISDVGLAFFLVPELRAAELAHKLNLGFVNIVQGVQVFCEAGVRDLLGELPPG
jgi:hypothetical protein